MLKQIIYILFLVYITPLSAQKTIEQIIDNPEIKTIFISDDNIFKIKINTTSDKTVKLQSRIEGEYTKDMIVSTETKNDTLFVSSSFQPFFKAPNNKLSAHKVLSVEVDLWMPKQLNVYVKSDIASAEIEGNYKNLTLELSQGNSTVTNFQGNATINSVNGNINIETNHATVNANSKTGDITKGKLTFGENQIKINTINGNISVTKTEK